MLEIEKPIIECVEQSEDGSYGFWFLWQNIFTLFERVFDLKRRWERKVDFH
jgi:hypothetical protein